MLNQIRATGSEDIVRGWTLLGRPQMERVFLKFENGGKNQILTKSIDKNKLILIDISNFLPPATAVLTGSNIDRSVSRSAIMVKVIFATTTCFTIYFLIVEKSMLVCQSGY